MADPYVVEPAKSGRSHCKVSKEIIEKGELRFGSYVTFGDRGSYHYRKLKCITDKVAANVVSKVGKPENVGGFSSLSSKQKAEFLKAFAAARRGKAMKAADATKVTKHVLKKPAAKVAAVMKKAAKATASAAARPAAKAKATAARGVPDFFKNLRAHLGGAKNSELMATATYSQTDLTGAANAKQAAEMIWAKFLSNAFPRAKDGDGYGSKAYIAICRRSFSLSRSQDAPNACGEMLDGMDEEPQNAFREAFDKRRVKEIAIAEVGDDEQIHGFVVAAVREGFCFGCALVND